MINIYKNINNNLVLYLNDEITLNNPYFVFEFDDIYDRKTIVTLNDESTAKSYNEFNFYEGSTGIINSSGTLNIYESSTNTVNLEGLNLIYNGIYKLIKESFTDVTYDPSISESSTVYDPQPAQPLTYYNLNITKTGSGITTPDSGPQIKFSEVLISALDDEQVFKYWIIDDTSTLDSSVYVTMNKDVSAHAVFGDEFKYSLTTTSVGSGTMTPANVTYHLPGELVILNATNDTQVFRHWTINGVEEYRTYGTPTGDSTAIFMDKDYVVSATFVDGYDVNGMIVGEGAWVLGNGHWPGGEFSIAPFPMPGNLFSKILDMEFTHPAQQKTSIPYVFDLNRNRNDIAIIFTRDTENTIKFKEEMIMMNGLFERIFNGSDDHSGSEGGEGD